MKGMRAVIFVNGEFNRPTAMEKPPTADDLLIAADGGARHCLSLGLRPDVVIGDLDSLAPEELKRLTADGVRVLRHPVRKDETDLELAFRLAREKGAREVILLGALGGRWDMTLANIMLPARPELSSLRVSILDGSQEITLVKAGETRWFSGRKGDVLSLIPISGDAVGVTLSGLEYPPRPGHPDHWLHLGGEQRFRRRKGLGPIGARSFNLPDKTRELKDLPTGTRRTPGGSINPTDCPSCRWPRPLPAGP